MTALHTVVDGEIVWHLDECQDCGAGPDAPCDIDCPSLAAAEGHTDCLTCGGTGSINLIWECGTVDGEHCPDCEGTGRAGGTLPVEQDPWAAYFAAGGAA